MTLGDGPPVVLLHGLAASLHDWDDMMPALASAGYHSFSPDLLGHGESAKPDDPCLYSADTVYDLLRDWIDNLELNQEILLVGHSMGGYLCLRYAQEYPKRVRGMVLINPFYSSKQLSPPLRLLYRRPAIGERAIRLAPLWLIYIILGWNPTNASDLSARAREQIAIDYKRASPKFIYIPPTLNHINVEVAQVQTPVQVIWGENDITLGSNSFSDLVSRLPNARGHSIPHSGHQPHIGKPEVVNKLVLDFFTTITQERRERQTHQTSR